MTGGDGLRQEPAADGTHFRWTRRVLSAEDLRGSLDGCRELVLTRGTVVTPLAAEHLRERGIRTRFESTEAATPAAPPPWGYGQDRPYPAVESAVAGLRTEGLHLEEWAHPSVEGEGEWARRVAERVAGACGGVVFCQDPGLFCCVANKVPGVRAAAATAVAQARRATRNLGVNLLAVEMPGRTYFEVRQILRTVCRCPRPACPSGLGAVLRELENHAHR